MEQHVKKQIALLPQLSGKQLLQKAQMGAQKAQSDLTKATAQHEQATRDAYAAEQQAQIDKLNDKTLAHATGNDIVTGGRAIEKHLENQDKIQKGNV